ncbi:hypothetical protein [Streptosporangium canum]|uniref:hypothetical protein n=1 Tax=Streptosporangium canum TaxID=324952 RepID=UPI003798A744
MTTMTQRQARHEIEAEVTEALVDDPDYRVQARLAGNLHCPPAVLATLARSRRPVQARREVAQNPHCPRALLKRLGRDRSAWVRQCAAWGQ